MNKELREDLEYLIICKDKTITQDLRDDVQMTLDYIDELENKIDTTKEHITYIIGITDDERIIAECNLIEEELKDE